MSRSLIERLAGDLDRRRREGVYKSLQPIKGPIGGRVELVDGRDMLMLCSNDYLGLANHPEVRGGAHRAIEAHGASTASVRFICGTMAIHETLETDLAAFLGVEAALTYSSCWAANTGLFAAITRPGDVVISDELNHASIIDGIRATQSGVHREVYRHGDMKDLAAKLRDHASASARIIVSDGVFSMEGDVAPLAEIADLARRHDALVVLDDSHGLGVVGATGRGVPELLGVQDQVDIHTGTFGKALGAGTGGFVAGPRAVTDSLVQSSRPHLFSNALTPAVAGAAIAALGVLRGEPDRVARLAANTAHFRNGLARRGVDALPGGAGIVAVIVGKTATAIAVAARLRDENIFAVGFGFPVVPEGTARLRFQLSAEHRRADLDRASNSIATALAVRGR